MESNIYGQWSSAIVGTPPSDSNRLRDRPTQVGNRVHVNTAAFMHHLADSSTIELDDLGHSPHLHRVTGRAPTPNVKYKETRRNILSCPGRRSRCVIGSCVLICCLYVFALLMAVSFHYVDYDQYALEVSVSTGAVKRDVTLYAGCYVLGPDSDLIHFPATAQTVDLLDQEVFTRERLAVTLSVTYLYFLRSEELGQLYNTYATGYAGVIEKIAIPVIKNEATTFSLDDLRLRRDEVASTLHTSIQRKLAGDCCREHCDFILCNDQCRHEHCSRGFHVDVKYFYLGRMTMPKDIDLIFLQSIVIQIHTETAAFKQEAAIIRKQTEFQVLQVENQAREKLENATSLASLITRQARYTADQFTQTAIMEGWRSLNLRLNLTSEEHQLSALWIKTLRQMDSYSSLGYKDLSRFVNT